MRTKGSTIFEDSAVAREITQMLNTHDKTQQEIAREIGLSKTNVMTMFKQGRTKLPLRLVVPLSKAVGREPRSLMELVLKEYQPELLDALDEALGVARSPEEQKMLETLRAARDDKQEGLDQSAKGQGQASRKRVTFNVSRSSLKKLYNYVHQNLLKVE